MKKIFLLLILLSFGMASAQTDKTTTKTQTKTEKKEKAKKADAKSSAEKRDKKDNKMAPQSTTTTATTQPNSKEPVMDDTPAAPGTNASPAVPLDSPTNRSNQSPENNGHSPTTPK